MSRDLDVLILIGQILEYDDFCLCIRYENFLEDYIDSAVCLDRCEFGSCRICLAIDIRINLSG